MSFVAFTPAMDSTAAKSISDADLRKYFDAHKTEFERPGRARAERRSTFRASLPPRTAPPRARSGARSAPRSSAARSSRTSPSVSRPTPCPARRAAISARARKGGSSPEFEKAAYALKAGELSQPVLTPFGYHLIRVDARKGDTLALRHILAAHPAERLVGGEASTSEADAAVEARGSSDSTARSSTRRRRSSASRRSQVQAIEGEPAMLNGSTCRA